MLLKGLKIGVALTGSFCTFKKAIDEIEELVKQGADVRAIFSYNALSINSRFGEARKFVKLIEKITKNSIISTIVEAEQVGPKKMFDVLVIMPCSGNTASKLANAITDTPVLMATKSHLRNQRPVVISISTNDALGLCMKNLGLLINSKNIYFVPFGQDMPTKKPNSLIADVKLLIPTIKSSLKAKQIQPIICKFQ